MESQQPPLPSLQPIEADVVSTGDSNFTLDKHTHLNTTTLINKKMKNKNNNTKKKRKAVQKPHVADPPQHSLNSVSSSSSSATSNVLRSRARGIRLSTNRGNPRNFSKRDNGGEADALALPLGMSIAAFVAQVLEKKDASGEKMSADHLAEICTLAVKESLSNVFGDKFDCFVSNFKRSFQSTLTTLRVISETSGNRERSNVHRESSSYDFRFDMNENMSTSNLQQEAAMLGGDEETNAVVHDSISRQNSQQLACVPLNRLHSGVSYSQSSMLTTFERSVSEQARSNDLTALKISLDMKKMRLREAQLAVDCDSNALERVKLSMGVSKAIFKAEKFKTELQDSKHAQFLRKCVDCLVAGLLIMVTCLAIGTYIYSHQRLIEANESCMLMKGSSSWWKPMSSFSSAFQVLQCQVQAYSRMLFGIFIIVAIVYLLIQRTGATNQTMPVTFILLLLGVGCGFAGKFCIDTLGGSGKHWLLLWEIFCLVHLFANTCTSMLFRILHGPVTVVDQSKSPRRMLFPYWFRRVVFYAAMYVYLPLLCGLMPFAGVGEWLERFASLVVSSVS